MGKHTSDRQPNVWRPSLDLLILMIPGRGWVSPMEGLDGPGYGPRPRLGLDVGPSEIRDPLRRP